MLKLLQHVLYFNPSSPSRYAWWTSWSSLSFDVVELTSSFLLFKIVEKHRPKFISVSITDWYCFSSLLTVHLLYLHWDCNTWYPDLLSASLIRSDWTTPAFLLSQLFKHFRPWQIRSIFLEMVVTTSWLIDFNSIVVYKGKTINSNPNCIFPLYGTVYLVKINYPINLNFSKRSMICSLCTSGWKWRRPMTDMNFDQRRSSFQTRGASQCGNYIIQMFYPLLMIPHTLWSPTCVFNVEMFIFKNLCTKHQHTAVWINFS